MVGTKTKPLGTITKYYPFIDEESRQVIDSVMNEAETYRDFTIRLAEKVVSENLSEMLAFIALIHADDHGLFGVIDKVAEKFENVDIIRPWILHSQLDRGILKDEDQVLDAIDKVLTSHNDDWIAIEFYYLKFLTYFIMAPIQRKHFAILDEALKLIATRDEFSCLAPKIHNLYSFRLLNLGDIEKGTEHAKICHKLASEYDDMVFVALSFLAKSDVFKNIDATKALEYVNQAQEMFELLDYRTGLAAVYNKLSLISQILGELDTAIECARRTIEIPESEGWPMGRIPPVVLARLYVLNGQGEDALEVLGKYFDRLEKNPWAHYIQAQAYVLIGQIEKAEECLDNGLEVGLGGGMYYETRGMIERAKGEIKSALRSYKRALKVVENMPMMIRKVPPLIGLTELEMVAASETNDYQHLENAELLLARLEQLANEQELHAVLIQVAILKAAIHKAERKIDSARDILTQAHKLSQPSSMKSLHTQVEESLKNLDAEESLSQILQRFTTDIQRMTVPPVRAKEIPFSILGCIVMLREAGLEVYSKYVDEKLTSDPSLVAGLISAVSSFTQELRENGKGELQSIVHQDIAVLLEHGENITSALLTDKDTYNARALQLRFLEEFEEEFSDDIAECCDGVAKYMAADKIFDSVFAEKVVDTN